MKTLSKRLKTVESLFDKTKTYSLKEAIAILKKTPKLKFDETVEISSNLNMDSQGAKGANITIRGTVALPHGTGKKVRIVVFCKGEEEKRARERREGEARDQNDNISANRRNKVTT